MFKIREFEPTDKEYESCAAVARAVWPEYPSVPEEWKKDDEIRDPKYFHQRVVAELTEGDEAGKIVAVGDYHQPDWSYEEGKYRININVHPDYTRRGIGTAFYEYLMDKLAERQATKVLCITREDKAVARHMLEKFNFPQIQKQHVSRIDVQAFESETFAPLMQKLESQHIHLYSGAELEALDPNWKREWWELDWALMQDVPTNTPFTRKEFEEFVRKLESPWLSPEALFFAVDESGGKAGNGGQYIGMTMLMIVPADKSQLNTGLTGVKREYRRKGVATALKAHALNFAKAYGAKEIETDNEEHNPMYQLNLKLGFKPIPGWLIFLKELRSEH